MPRLPVAVIAGALLVGLSGVASAQDMPVKRPAAVVAAAWTGPYIGLNAGDARNDRRIDNRILSVFCDQAGIIGPVCSTHPNITDALVASVPPGFDTTPKGFIGGGQIGYGFQPTPQLVWGIEADFQDAHVRGSANTLTRSPFFFDVATVTGAASQKIDFFGTLRARLGWLPIEPLLLYATGGLAYGHLETSVSFLRSVPCIGCDRFTSASDDRWRAGWTVGGGLEWMVVPRWSIRAEYLYYDLGHVTLNQTIAQDFGNPPFVSVTVASEAPYKGSIFRGAINYHM
jgi:outer membrane immunogenic protein